MAVLSYLDLLDADLANQLAALPEATLEKARRRLFLSYFDQDPLDAAPLLDLAAILREDGRLTGETRDRLAQQLTELLRTYSLAFEGFMQELETRDLSSLELWLYDRLLREDNLINSASCILHGSAFSSLSYLTYIHATARTGEGREKAIARLKSVLSHVLSNEDVE